MAYEIPTTLDPSYALLASSLVGFVKLNADGSAELRGSGTLISIENVHGILTAAHVVDVVPIPEFGLLLFTRPDATNRFKISLERHDLIIADGWNSQDESGPDLGFVRLSNPERVAALKARGCIFHNLVGKPAQSITRTEPQEFCFSGVVNETRVQGSNGDFDRTGYTAMFSPLKSRQITQDGRLLSVVPDLGKTSPPRTYQGVSGGPLWTFQDKADGSQARLVIGVASREIKSADDVGTIVFESMRSIGDSLLPAILRRFDQQ